MFYCLKAVCESIKNPITEERLIECVQEVERRRMLPPPPQYHHQQQNGPYHHH